MIDDALLLGALCGAFLLLLSLCAYLADRVDERSVWTDRRDARRRGAR